jgi:hypothetical protein
VDSGRYLSFAEREQIALWRAEKMGVRQIAPPWKAAADNFIRTANDILGANLPVAGIGYSMVKCATGLSAGPTGINLSQHVLGGLEALLDRPRAPATQISSRNGVCAGAAQR